MRVPVLLVAAAAAVSSIAGCGGKVAPVVDDLAFAPQQRSAGYGYVGGMHVQLVDPTTDGVQRTLHLDAADLSGQFSVEAGTVHVTLVELRPDGTSATYGTVSGTVSIEDAGGPTGGERVDLDLLFADPGASWHERHLTGSYVAPLDYEG